MKAYNLTERDYSIEVHPMPLLEYSIPDDSEEHLGSLNSYNFASSDEPSTSKLAEFIDSKRSSSTINFTSSEKHSAESTDFIDSKESSSSTYLTQECEIHNPKGYSNIIDTNLVFSNRIERFKELINTENLNEEDTDHVQTILEEYDDCFHLSGENLNLTTPEDLRSSVRAQRPELLFRRS